MVGFKVNVALLRTSASVLAVFLVTSGAFAEDEDTAGTEPGAGGIAVEIYPPADPVLDPIHATDPLPPEYPEEGVVEAEPDPVDDTGDDGTGGDLGTGDGDLGTGDGEVGTGDGEVGTGGSDVVVIYDFGIESECGGCEFQSSAGPVVPSAPGGEMVQRSGGDVVQRSVRRSAAASTTAVKDSCVDPERYVAWICDWQKDLGLIGR